MIENSYHHYIINLFKEENERFLCCKRMICCGHEIKHLILICVEKFYRYIENEIAGHVLPFCTTNMADRNVP